MKELVSVSVKPRTYVFSLITSPYPSNLASTIDKTAPRIITNSIKNSEDFPYFTLLKLVLCLLVDKIHKAIILKNTM